MHYVNVQKVVKRQTGSKLASEGKKGENIEKRTIIIYNRVLYILSLHHYKHVSLDGVNERWVGVNSAGA